MPRTILTLTLSSLVMVSACDKETEKTDTAAPTPAEPAEARDGASPAADEAGAERVKVVDGAAPGDEDRYVLAVEPPAEAATGEEARVKVKVVPKDPWHINLDFPTSLKMEAPDGVKLAKADLKKADADKLDDENCEFTVAFTPQEAGEKAFTGTFKFAVCQDEACSPVTEDVEFRVAVK